MGAAMIITTDKEMRDRDPYDHYPTPIGLCTAALERLDDVPACPQILDPGAGAGPWGQAARKIWPVASIYGVEVRDTPKPEGYSFWFAKYGYIPISTPRLPLGPFKDDKARVRALKKYEADLWVSQQPVWSAATGAYDLIIGNPPYEYAEEFVRQSLRYLAPTGRIVFLLRLAFLESQERGVGLWREHPPYRVLTCSKRPSFTGNGKTDSAAYAVYYWKHGHQGDFVGGWISYQDIPEGQSVMELAA
jgi:hypothetical protein